MRLKPCGVRRSLGVNRFLSDARGAVAPMFGVLFAFALLPLGGAAIDLSRVLTSKSDLQDSLDATALALGKMPLNSTQEQLQAAADKWMKNNAHDQNLTDPHVTVKATYADNTTTMSKVELTATAAVISIFNGSIGGVQFGQYPVGARTTTSWGLQRVEVALVLDNTGSMMESDGSGSTKSATLKQAAKDLIDALAGTATSSGDPNVFKIGMVPFATYVNVGAANQGAWITGTSPYDNDIFSAPTDRFALFAKLGTTWAGCVESRPMPYDIQDATPSPGDPKSMFVPYFAPDEPDDTYTDSAGQVWDQYSNSYLPDGAPAGPALAMNDRLTQLCTNMKDAGVTLYTIPLLVTNANTKAMLQTCASSNDKYLEASTGDQLRADFKNIAGSISALRISK